MGKNARVAAFLTAAGALVVGAREVPAETRHVPAQFSTINAALDASALGDTVLVAPGTYSDSEVRGDVFTRRSCAFLADGVVLRSESGPEMTIIDMAGAPGPQASVVNAEGLPSELTQVEGFTLTGAPMSGRGAWVIGVGKVTFRNCIFRDMDANPSSGAGLAANGDVDIIECEFVNCLGNAGGAIYHSGGHINLLGTTIRECGNKGAYLTGDPPDAESALIEDCVFLDNWSSNAAAGLHISAYDAGAVVRSCHFEGNVAHGTGGGGLAWGNEGDKLIEGCVFLRNGTDGSNGQGGALSVGGGGVCVLRGNTFYGNYQTYPFLGGASVYVNAATTFEGNVVVGSSGSAAVYVEEYDIGSIVTGCNIYWDNPDGVGVPLAATDREVDPQFCDPENHDFTVSETSPCVEPGSLGCGQIGALGIGCGTTAIETESWGGIKAQFREGERP